MNSGRLLIVIITIFLLVVGFVNAEEKYSFEESESMKDLIKWRDYGHGVFIDADKENKPIFLLLTAPSWCYWCQVYESEDYLFNPQVVKLINERFIPVYVDADKRQDITRKYLEGGWPSTTILTPWNERIYGYSGPRPVGNMIANLNSVVDHVNNNKNKLKVNYDYEDDNVVELNDGLLKIYIDNYFSYVFSVYDSVNGGFGNGQKFPQGRTLDLSLELYEKTGDVKWLELVINTIKNQYTKIDELESNYRLFDPVEGGFHRYGTSISWSPPHYEKMLYDNARLLKTYFHLKEVFKSSLPFQNGEREMASSQTINEVVEKTDKFIQREWFDAKNGGFYGNSDVHGEDAYYGKNPRPDVKPRVEKTKYTEWNSEAIMTYLYLFEKTGNENYKEIVVKSLNFYLNMFNENGAYHYVGIEGKKSIQGNLLDNSYLMLAFVEGYSVLGDDRYLKAAVDLAEYSLDNLYDWNSGGFFERNSKDKNNYAPGENIDLSKPSEENSVMAYGMLRIYQETDEIIYLNAGIKTLGVKIVNSGGLDNVYYFVKSSNLIINDRLINKFESVRAKINLIEDERVKGFWLNVLLENQ